MPKNGNSKKKLQICIFLSLVSILSIVSAVKITDTVFFSSSSNSTIYFNSSVWADEFSVNNESLMVYNITTNSTNAFLFSNPNATYKGRINISRIKNCLAFDSNNGTIYGNTNINLNDGSINITASPLHNYTILDDFNLTEGISRTNSPISIMSITKSTLTDTVKINSTITNEISINVYEIPVDNCNINSITMKPKDKAAYTITDFSCTDNVLTYINGVNLTYSLSSNELYINYEYRSESNNVCVYMVESYDNFFKIIPILGTILGVLILLGGIGMVIYGIKNPDVVSEKIESIDWDKLTSLNLVTGTILGIGIIAILSVVSIISLHFICAV